MTRTRGGEFETWHAAAEGGENLHKENGRAVFKPGVTLRICIDPEKEITKAAHFHPIKNGVVDHSVHRAVGEGKLNKGGRNNSLANRRHIYSMAKNKRNPGIFSDDMLV
jgi:hypothetical protein